MLLQIPLRTRLSKPREGFPSRGTSPREVPRGVALDSAKDQAELREAPRPREGSSRENDVLSCLAKNKCKGVQVIKLFNPDFAVKSLMGNAFRIKAI